MNIRHDNDLVQKAYRPNTFTITDSTRSSSQRVWSCNKGWMQEAGAVVVSNGFWGHIPSKWQKYNTITQQWATVFLVIWKIWFMVRFEYMVYVYFIDKHKGLLSHALLQFQTISHWVFSNRSSQSFGKLFECPANWEHAALWWMHDGCLWTGTSVYWCPEPKWF